MDTNPTTNGENKVYPAKHVYLLMKKEYRISRNIRALWYLQHLNNIVHYRPVQVLGDEAEELTVLSVVPKDERIKFELGKEYQLLLTPETILTFISRRYRLVFTLDLSPSAASVDLCSGEVLYDEVLKTLQNCLKGLVQPFTLPGSYLVLSPEVYVTVIAHTPLLACATNQVLAQGMLISRENVDEFLREARHKLASFETSLVQTFGKMIRTSDYLDRDGVNLTGGLFMDIVDEPAHSVPPDNLASPETSFVNMLRYGILALQLLPENTSAGVVLITDGMVGLPDATMFESLLVQLRNGTIACSFLRLGSSHTGTCQMGHIPHVELLQFLATATFGAYFSTCPHVSEGTELWMNIYHQAFFCWNFQKGLDGFKIEDLPDKNFAELTEDLAWRSRPCLPSRHGSKWENLSPVVKKKHVETTLHTSICSVMSLRLREGYTIKDINFTKGGSELIVKLALPWRDFVRIEYVASSCWPLESTKMATRTEIVLEGSYEFLHDVTCPLKKPFRSLYRTAVVKKFWQTLQGISQTDQLLVHLQSFASNPVYYHIPDSIKNGVPLFYLQPNSATPTLSLQHSSKDNALAQFASFWKPVVMLDINIWQKWMHTHRIGILLEHDTPLPKYLHIPNSSRRFNTIQCRQALSSLNLLLRAWGTFVLVENHSYIKLLFSEADKPPTSFLLLRVTSKPPCMVLRLAFLGGTPGHERNQLTRELREKVLALKFPHRGTQKSEKVKRVEKKVEGSEKGENKLRKPPLLRDWSDIHCCVLVSKPVEKILIRYERIPRDMMCLEDPTKDPDLMGSQITSPNKAAANMFTMLSRYLLHQRWVWSIQQSNSAPINMQAISKILSTLTKIRLQEGFHFAMSNMGVITMVLEVDMKRMLGEESCKKGDVLATCVIQYILFPAYTKTTRASVSEDDIDEMETTEADGELQIITECWVEPQSGTVIHSSPEREYMEGLQFHELAKKFYPIDLECISCLITFQHLVTICQCYNLTAPDSQLPIYASTPPQSPSHGRSSRTSNERTNGAEPSIHHTPFPFDLLSLLPRCQQAELIFSTYNSDHKSDAAEDLRATNNLLFDQLFEKFKHHHDREVILSANDCLNFMKLVTERRRDVQAQPYPFKFAGIFTNTTTSGDEVEEAADVHDNVFDPAPDVEGTNVPEVSSLPESKEAEKDSARSGSDKELDSQGEKCGPAVNVKALETPSWKCLVKVDTTNHLILSFLPASYDDLALLNLHQLRDTTVHHAYQPDPSQTDTVKQQASVSTLEPAIGELSSTSDKLGNVGKEKSDSSIDSASQVSTKPDGDSSFLSISMPAEVKEASTSSDQTAPSDSPLMTQPMEPNEWPESESNTDTHLEESHSTLNALTNFLIPIYVYDCYLSYLTNSLVNRWNFHVSDDLFEDLTFPADVDLSEQSGTVPLSPRVRLASHETEAMREFDREDSHDAVKERWRMSLDRRSTDSLSDFHGALWQHCTVLGEAYFTGYVKGIFENLQLGHQVSRHDVMAAINNICEESLPLEADMTSFLETSCGHLLSSIERSKHDGLSDRMDVSLPGKSTVRFVDLPGDSDIDNVSDAEDLGTVSMPDFDLIPRGSTVRVCLSDLRIHMPCEQIMGLHHLVKYKFMEILKLWFKPIPSCPDYYYYSPEIEIIQNMDSNCQNGAAEGQSDLPTEKLKRINEESDYFLSDFDPEYEDTDGDQLLSDDQSEGEFSTMSNRGSPSDDSDHSIMDDDLESVESEHSRNEPLFLHFTCTLKNKRNHYNISVQLLPTCVGDLTGELEGVNEIDLADLKVTFDINCLTLPTDSDFSSLPRRPKYMRMSSHTSASPSQSDAEGEDAVSTTTSHDAFLARGIDPISSIPKLQKKAVENLKKEIEWLLRDEVTSSLRHIYPVTTTTLQLVANHVKESSGKPACIAESIVLKFVFGQDHSLQRFIQEFEKMNLSGYRVMKEDQFYFIVVDRARPRGWAHAMELNSKLVELSREGSPAKEVQQFSTESDNAISAEISAEKSADNTVSSGLNQTERGQRGNHDNSTLLTQSFLVLGDERINQSGEAMDKLSLDITSLPSIESQSREATSEADLGQKLQLESGLKPEESVEVVEAIERDDSLEPEKNVITPIKPPMGLCDVRSRSSYPCVTGPSAQQSLILKRSSSFSGFMVEGENSPTTSTPDKEAPVKEGELPTLKSVASAPQMALQGRVRHFSGPPGPGTPVSRTSTRPQTPSWVSSTGSCTEEGYEGGSSDSDSDDEVISSGGMNIQSPLIINFWLLMRIHPDKVDVFYHARDTGEKDNEEMVHQRELLSDVHNNIKQICRTVNQHKLLVELYDSRMCNSLLVPEADDDVTWRRDSLTKHKQPSSDAELEDDEEEREQSYLMDNLMLMPGHFACDCVLKHPFVLHPRMKTGPARGPGTSRGVQVLRSVLNAFSVNNRKNMFVIKEAPDNVFYLRLQDSTCMVTEPGSADNSLQAKDAEDAVSASSSLKCLSNSRSTTNVKTGLDKEESDMSFDKEADNVSVGSSGIMRMDSRQEECVEVSVHGICPPGPEIREGLIQTLQKRLDEDILEMISLMLLRNPMCKLTPDDVHFIQKPYHPPSKVVLLTVPSYTMLQLSSLMYYLRQNLLQFLHVPNYTESRADSRFQDCTDDVWDAIPDGNAYLYNRPQASGGKGIGCISLSLVDGLQKMKYLIDCCKPSPMAYMEWLDRNSMERLVETSIYNLDPESTGPGPTALVRFRIWGRGQVDVDSLVEKLIEAVRHALCDMVLEYRLLTTPVCTVPGDQALEEELKTLILVEPIISPPRTFSDGKERERRMSGLRGLDQGRSPSKPGGPPPSPFQTLFSEFKKKTLSPSAKDSPKTFDFPSVGSGAVSAGIGGMSWQEIDPARHRDSDLKTLIQKYESGEKGTLQLKYWTALIDWMNLCSYKGCPSIQKTQMTVLSRYSVDTVLREVQNCVTQVSSDVRPVVFKLTGQTGVPYSVSRHPIQVADNSHESSLDVYTGPVTSLGKANNYLMIGRNYNQWKVCLDQSSMEDMPADVVPSSSTGSAIKKFLKFPPYNYSKGRDKLPPEFDCSTELLEELSLPRQRLLLVTVRDKELCLYTYNWAGDLTSMLSQKFTRLVQWHSSRSHLLHNLFSQKMGLFHHHILTEPPACQITNPFIQQNMEIELLIKSSIPPSREPQRRQTNSMQGTSGLMAHLHVRIYRPWDETYMGLKPPKPLQRASYGTTRDPVSRHGMQAQEIRHCERRETERCIKLQKLYHEWHQRPGSSLPIAEDYITLLKQASRLVHYCATPMLLGPKWRHKAMARPDAGRPCSVPVTSSSLEKTELRSRSRHSSGASITSKGKRSESQEKRKSAPTPTDSTEFRPLEQPEEPWHIELRSSFLTQYIQYLQSLGFMQIQTRPTTPKRGLSRSLSKRGEEKTTSTEDEERLRKRSMLTNLQKTLPGGIMLMELSFKDVYFCVKLFAYDCMQLPVGTTVNPQLQLFFVDECDKYRDLIHVHSFAHDFHLRCIQSYIHGRQYEFTQGYHVAGFLADFYHIHPYPPSFARNYLYEGKMSFSNINTSSQQLYEYMIEHDKLYDMKAIKMTAPICEPDYEVVKETEFALVCQNFHRSSYDDLDDLKHKMEDYDVGLVIVEEGYTMLEEIENQVDKDRLRVRYYIIMTSRRDLFPRFCLEKKLGMFRNIGLKQLPADKNFVVVSGSPLPYSESVTDLSALTLDSQLSQPVPVRQHIGVRQESVNYLGYSNIDQKPILSLLQQEVTAAEQKITGMVEGSMTQCRRDVLWERLIVGGEAMDEESKRKKRSDTDDSKPFYKLTFSEFTELLEMVTKWPLHNLDDRLVALENMSLSWYHSLAHLLITKNAQNHRQFVSSDGTIQFVALINPWTNSRKLENFMLLQVNNQSHRAELCAVFRETGASEDLSSHIFNLTNVQSYMESFINICCFHLWTSMLS